MNIVANINFYIIFKTITNEARLHLLPFILTKKGLKYVWIETTHKEMDSLKLKPTYTLYIYRTDFLIKDYGWFAKEQGKVKIPFKEEHLNIAHLC